MGQIPIFLEGNIFTFEITLISSNFSVGFLAIFSVVFLAIFLWDISIFEISLISGTRWTEGNARQEDNIVLGGRKKIVKQKKAMEPKSRKSFQKRTKCISC